MNLPGLLRILDAAYRFDVDEMAWLDGVTASLRPLLDKGQGIHAFLLDLRDPDAVRIESPTGVGMAPEWETRWRSDWWQGYMLALPSRTLHALLTSGPCNRSIELWSATARRDPVFEAPSLVDIGSASVRGAVLYPDSVNVLAIDATGLGCCFAGNRLASDSMPLDNQTIHTLSRLATHIAAAYRLRRRGSTAFSPDAASAIVSDSLDVIHADTTASSNRALDAIRQSIRSLQALRAPTFERQSADGALAAWKALTAGEWSVLDQFDADGRRYYLARPNTPDPRETESLTMREQQVARSLALGHSNKLIAYELGLHPSTVSQHIAAAALKLGAANRIELVRVLRGQPQRSPTPHTEPDND